MDVIVIVLLIVLNLNIAYQGMLLRSGLYNIESDLDRLDDTTGRIKANLKDVQVLIARDK